MRILRKILLFFAFPVLVSFVPGPEGEYRVLKNTSFLRGEKMSFRLHYSIFNAGEALFEVSPNLFTLNNRICYRITVFGRSTGAFGMMMKIRDTWGTYMDTCSLISHRSYRDILENNYRLQEYINFRPLEGKAQVETHHNGEFHKEYTIPMNIQDIVSGFYYLRTIDFTNYEKGDIISIDAFFESKLYDFEVRFMGVGRIKTKFGHIDAYKLVPIMPENELFDGGNSISCWLSADLNHMPLKVKAELFVGAVEIDLEGFEGMRYPVCFKR